MVDSGNPHDPERPLGADVFLADLAIVTAVAAVTGMLARRLGQPSILGHLSAGLIVGPYLPIPLFADPHRIEAMAELGVVLVMFAVGLEFRVRRLLEILPVSGLTAVVQIATLLSCGVALGGMLGWSGPAALTLGCALAISSTMVVSGVLGSVPVDEDIRSHIFGVLVVQDVVAILLMAVVTTLAAGQSLEPASVLMLVVELVGVVVAMLVAGMLVVPRLITIASGMADDDVLAVLAVGTAFAFAAVAGGLGYSPALGAFLSGMVVAESGRGHAVEDAIGPLKAVFSAIFFVSIGMTVDPAIAWATLPLALGVTAVVIVGQLASVGIGSVLTGSSLRKGLISGLALGQIGELSFILATIASVGGLVPPETLPVLVTVATLTAFTTPLLLRRNGAIVGFVDRRLPARAQHVLSAYQSVLRRGLQNGEEPSLRQPAVALVLDWAALVLIVLLRGPIRNTVPSWGWVVDVGAVLIALPLVLALARTAGGFVHAVGVRAGRRTPALAPAVRGVASLAVWMWMGLPTIAILGPIVFGTWIELVVVLLVVGVAMWLIPRQPEFEDAYTSGVAQIAGRLAAAEPEEAEDPLDSVAVVDAMEAIDHHRIGLPADSLAVGRTLAELDLRSRTGATVLAISRGEDQVLLPTGHEVLAGEDRLAIAGSPEAIERARRVLNESSAA